MQAARWASILSQYQSASAAGDTRSLSRQVNVHPSAHIMALISTAARLSQRKSSNHFNETEDSDSDNEEDNAVATSDGVSTDTRKRKQSKLLLNQKGTKGRRGRKNKPSAECINSFENQLLEGPVRGLMAKLRLLQEQWPGHEVLQLLMRMCHRLLYASVADPLMKTIAGVQLLLYKAQQWESYAAKHVSLDNELKPFRTLMKRWRRIELLSWTKFLDDEEEKFARSARTWWPHLYSTFQTTFGASETATASAVEGMTPVMQKRVNWILPGVLQGDKTLAAEVKYESFDGAEGQPRKRGEDYDASSATIADAAKRKNARWGWSDVSSAEPEAQESDENLSADELDRQACEKFLSSSFELIDRFLRSPAIGEFSQRLALVASFYHQQLALASSATNHQRKFFLFQTASTTLNVLQYYRQFAPTIARRIAQARAPLEKKLREHAKLSRWDDRTYYSLYESSEKAHRVIHKIVLEYREALEMPVHILLDESLNFSCAATTDDSIFISEFSNVPRGPPPLRLDDLLKPVSTDTPLSAKATLPTSVAERLEKSRLSKIVKISTKMKQLIALDSFQPLEGMESNPSALLGAHAEAVDAFTSAVIGRWNSVKSDEVNWQMKQLALNGVLKQCKARGLIHHTNAVPTPHRHFSHLFRVPILPSTDVSATKQFGSLHPKVPDPHASMALGKGTEYYYRALPFISRARQLATGGLSKDLSLRESRQMLGYSEYSLFLSSQQRFILHRAASVLSKLTAHVEVATEVADTVVSILENGHGAVIGERSVAPATGANTDSLSNVVCSAWKPLEWLRRVSAAQMSVSAIRETLEEQRLLTQAIIHSHSGTSDEQLAALEELEQACSVALDALDAPAFKRKLDACGPLQAAETTPAGLKNNNVNIAFVVLSRHVTSWNEFASQLRDRILEPCRSRVEAVNKRCILATGLTSSLQSTFQNALSAALLQPIEFDKRHAPLTDSNSASEAEQTDVDALSEVEGVINSCMVIAQLYRRAALSGADLLHAANGAKPVSTLDTDEGDVKTEKLNDVRDNLCLRVHQLVVKSTTHSHFDTITSSLRSLIATLNAASTSSSTKDFILRMLADISPLLQSTLVAANQSFATSVTIFQAMAKNAYIFARATASILKNGFGAPPREDGDGDDEGDDDMDGKEFDGTGMGEGQGSKDVSDQIEDEEQLLGLKGEDNQMDEQPDQQDGDQGVEMQNDFDGEMFDLKENQEGDDDDSNEDDEELDREMQEFEGDEEEEVVDERLWDSDDEEDENKPEDEQDKFEEGEGVQGAKPTDELRSNEDDNPDQQSDEKDKQDPQEDGDADEGVGEDEDDHNINNDYDDNYEEQHPDVDLQKPEDADGDFEIPDNVDDNGDDGDDDDNADDADDANKEQADDDGDDKDEETGDKDAQMDDETQEEEEVVAEDAKQTDDANPDESEQAAGGEDEDVETEPPSPDNEDGETGEHDLEFPEFPEQDNDNASEPESDAESGDDNDDENNLLQDTAMEPEGDDDEEEHPQSNPNDELNSADKVGDVDPNTAPDVDNEDDRTNTGGLQQSEDDSGKPQENNESDANTQNPYELSAEDPAPQFSWHNQTQSADEAQPRSEQGPDERSKNPRSQGGDQSSEDNVSKPPPKQWKRDLLDLGGGEDDQTDANEDVVQDNEKVNEFAVDERATREILSARDDDDDAQQTENGEPDDDAGGEEQDAPQLSEEPAGSDHPNGDDGQEEDDDATANDDQTVLSREYKRHQFAKQIMSLPKSNDDADDTNEEESEMSTWMEHAHEMLERLAQQNASNDMANSTSLDNISKGERQSSTSESSQEEVDTPQHDLLDSGRRELEDLRQELQRFSARLPEASSEDGSASSKADPEDVLRRGVELWRCYEALTANASQQLCEQLRLVLEPMLATKLKGDYRTGKRINMRKVIPFIASQFQKDKIWLRRTAPNKRNYQVVVAIDDSLSMQHVGDADKRSVPTEGAPVGGITPGAMACEAMTTICTAMTQLEVGELAVMSFGDSVRLLHPFDKQFTSEAAGSVMSQFTFRQESTDFCRTLESLVSILSSAQNPATSEGTTTQLVFLISDGHIDQGNRARVGKWVRHARQQNQLMVLIIVDPVLEEQRLIKFGPSGIENIPYMEDYPFPFYLVLKNLRDMPNALGDALRQWFELLQHEE